MLIMANVVAIVAIVAILAGLAGIWLTNRNQLALIRDRYLRDHRTSVYMTLLKAVHLRQVMVSEAFTLPQGQKSPLPTADQTSEIEFDFGAGILGFASQEVYDLWPVLDEATTRLVAVMNDLRLMHNVAPEQIPNVKDMPTLKEADAKWQKARSDLVNQVRGELEFNNPRPRWLWPRFLRIKISRARAPQLRS